MDKKIKFQAFNLKVQSLMTSGGFKLSMHIPASEALAAAELLMRSQQTAESYAEGGGDARVAKVEVEI